MPSILQSVFGLGLCIEIKSYVAHILYVWTMSHNTEIPSLYNNRRYFSSHDLVKSVCLGCDLG